MAHVVSLNVAEVCRACMRVKGLTAPAVFFPVIWKHIHGSLIFKDLDSDFHLALEVAIKMANIKSKLWTCTISNRWVGKMVWADDTQLLLSSEVQGWQCGCHLFEMKYLSWKIKTVFLRQNVNLIWYVCYAMKNDLAIYVTEIVILQKLISQTCSSISSVQFSSVAQSCPTLCDPMNCGTPGLPVHHQLPEFTQTHIHRVSDAIQPSHPRSPPSPPALNPSQHQSLFQWVNSSHKVA